MPVSQSQLVGVGIVVAFAAAGWFAGRRGVGKVEIFALLGLLGVAAVAGARGFALLEWWLTDRQAAWIWNPFAPAGYSSAGALLGAGAVLLGHRLAFGREEFLRTLDVAAPASLLGLAFARAGCVFEGCDYGTPSSLPWAVEHAVRGAPAAELGGAVTVHPFGFYIAVPLALLAIWGCMQRSLPVGSGAIVVVAGYGVIRFVAEFFRADQNASVPFGPFHLGHLVAVFVIAVAGFYVLVEARSVWRDPDGR